MEHSIPKLELNKKFIPKIQLENCEPLETKFK